jgi:hypothetical protein
MSPAAYEVSYGGDGTIARVAPREVRSARGGDQAAPARGGRWETVSTVKSPKAEYGHMQLLEVGKGCGAAAASASRARCTGRCGTAAWKRSASRWRRSPRSPSGWGWWGPACRTIRGSAS